MVLPQLDCGKMGRWGLSTKTSRLASGGLSPRRRRSTPASIAPRMTGRDRIWVTILFTNHLDLLILLFWRCFHSSLSCRSLTAFMKFLSYWLLAGFTHQHSTLRKEDDMKCSLIFIFLKRRGSSMNPVPQSWWKGYGNDRSIQLTCHMRDLTTLARRGRVLDFLVATWFSFLVVLARLHSGFRLAEFR